MRRLAVAFVIVAVLATACSDESGRGADPIDGDERASVEADGSSEPLTSNGVPIGPRPAVPGGPTSAALADDVDELLSALVSDTLDEGLIRDVGSHGDARVGWLLADLLSVAVTAEQVRAIVATFDELTGSDLGGRAGSSVWKAMHDLLIAWDLAALSEHEEHKEAIFTRIEPAWRQFFADEESLIDWRLVTWGGVFVDDRSLGSPLPCSRGCIAALDDPPVTVASEGDWYPDEAIVFGVLVEGEARAYPKNIMEVHELVNDTVGGRRVALPYCTLCGSAQLFFTDSVPPEIGTPVLRTSGLLNRSNKIMYDQVTGSAFDTFRGVAVSGSLREAGVVLDQGAVVTSSWGAWRAAHPDTTVVRSDAGHEGREYPLDPLRGRDHDGPIFPVGDVDLRLAVQTAVVAAIAPDATPVAFDATAARAVLADGGRVEASGVRLLLDGDGLRAQDLDGHEVAAHESFWFAWSQFHPDTAVWTSP